MASPAMKCLGKYNKCALSCYDTLTFCAFLGLIQVQPPFPVGSEPLELLELSWIPGGQRLACEENKASLKPAWRAGAARLPFPGEASTFFFFSPFHSALSPIISLSLSPFFPSSLIFYFPFYLHLIFSSLFSFTSLSLFPFFSPRRCPNERLEVVYPFSQYDLNNFYDFISN